MRRKDREITNSQELRQVLDSCAVCRLGLSDAGQPYIVPLNFGYRWDDEGLVLYFHCAREGRKLDILSRNARVCFELDHGHALVAGERACQFSMQYESVMGEGTAALVTDPAEHEVALALLMQHYTGRSDWSFEPKAVAGTAAIRLQVTHLSGKRLAR